MGEYNPKDVITPTGPTDGPGKNGNKPGLSNLDVIIIVVCVMAVILCALAAGWTFYRRRKNSLDIDETRYGDQANLLKGRKSGDIARESGEADVSVASVQAPGGIN